MPRACQYCAVCIWATKASATRQGAGRIIGLSISRPAITAQAPTTATSTAMRQPITLVAARRAGDGDATLLSELTSASPLPDDVFVGEAFDFAGCFHSGQQLVPALTLEVDVQRFEDHGVFDEGRGHFGVVEVDLTHRVGVLVAVFDAAPQRPVEAAQRFGVLFGELRGGDPQRLRGVGQELPDSGADPGESFVEGVEHENAERE